MVALYELLVAPPIGVPLSFQTYDVPLLLLNVTLPLLQSASEPPSVIFAFGSGFTVTVILFEVAEAHVPL